MCNIKVHQKIHRTAPLVVVFSYIFHLWWSIVNPFQRTVTVRLSRFNTSLNPHIPPNVSYLQRSDTKYVLNFRYFTPRLQSTTIMAAWCAWISVQLNVQKKQVLRGKFSS